MIEYVKQNIKRQSLHDDTHFRHFSNTFSWAFVDFSLIFWYFCHFVVNFVHRRALLHISYNKTHIKVVLFFQFHTISVFFFLFGAHFLGENVGFLSFLVENIRKITVFCLSQNHKTNLSSITKSCKSIQISIYYNPV